MCFWSREVYKLKIDYIFRKTYNWNKGEKQTKAVNYTKARVVNKVLELGLVKWKVCRDIDQFLPGNTGGLYLPTGKQYSEEYNFKQQ